MRYDNWTIVLGIFAVANLANGIWMLVDPGHWFVTLPAAVPDTGPLNSGESATVSADIVNTSGLAEGTYTTELKFVDNCGKGQPNQVMQLGHGVPVCRFDNVRIGE